MRDSGFGLVDADVTDDRAGVAGSTGVQEEGAERRQRRDAIRRGLGFSPPLAELFGAGTVLRDSDGIPARKYLLGHAARELKRTLHVHLSDYAASPEDRRTRPKRVEISSRVAQRWVAEVSPAVESFAGDSRPTASVALPADLAFEINRAMRYKAAVAENLLSRMADGLRALQRYVPLETLSAAVETLFQMEPHKFGHVHDLGEDFADSEVLALWDELETVLFDLFGSPAWAYETVDNTIQELNEL